MSSPAAVIDADVLYGIEVTDLLLTLATRRVIRVHWSTEILDEVKRNLVERPDMTAEAIDYRIDRMNAALPDALADAPADLADAMPVNTKDQHVLAIAVHLEVGLLVTNNLRDFPADACAACGVEPLGPDEFVTRVVRQDLVTVREVLGEMAARRRNPPLDPGQLVERLSVPLPSFAALLRS